MLGTPQRTHQPSDPERTIWQNPRGLASAGAPAITGAMFAASLYAWPLVIGGALKIAYDLILLFMFRKVKPPEEE